MIPNPSNRLSNPRIANPADCHRVQHQWSALHSQHVHRRCCHSPEEQQLLAHAMQRVSESKCRFDPEVDLLKPNTLAETLSILACSPGYDRREDVIRCGTTKLHHCFRCRDKHLCQDCCDRYVRNPLLVEFDDSFSASPEVYYIVISLTDNPDPEAQVKFADWTNHRANAGGTAQHKAREHPLGEYGIPFSTSEDAKQARIYTEIFSSALKKATGRKSKCKFAGAIGSPEIALRLDPLRVLPHLNVIGFSECFTPDDARDLRNLVAKKMRDSRRLRPGKYPSVWVYRLKRREDLVRVIGYVSKSIDLAGQYRAAIAGKSTDVAALSAVNRDVTSFLQNLPLAFHRVPRVRRFGCCHSQAKGYIGRVSAYRLRARAKQKDYRALRKLQPMKVLRRRKLNRGRRRKSRFGFWDWWTARNLLPSRPTQPAPVPWAQPPPIHFAE